MALVAAPARQLGLPARRTARHAQFPAHGQACQSMLDHQVGAGIEAQALQVGGGKGGKGGAGGAGGISNGHGRVSSGSPAR
jgi:hypothetical protein